MSLPHAAIAVFTSKPLEMLLAHGGSGPWVGAEERAPQQEYLVCMRKAKPGKEGHGAAFLVGKMSHVRKLGFDRRGQQRWFFEISEYAFRAIKDTGRGVAQPRPIYDAGRAWD